MKKSDLYELLVIVTTIVLYWSFMYNGPSIAAIGGMLFMYAIERMVDSAKSEATAAYNCSGTDAACNCSEASSSAGSYDEKD